MPGSLEEVENQGVRQAVDTLLRATHVGTRIIQHRHGKIMTLKEVYLVPSLAINLISVSALTNSGYKVMFSHDKGEVRNKKSEALKLEKSNKAWIFPKAMARVNPTTDKEWKAYMSSMDAMLFHERMGHPGPNRLKLAH